MLTSVPQGEFTKRPSFMHLIIGFSLKTNIRDNIIQANLTGKILFRFFYFRHFGRTSSNPPCGNDPETEAVSVSAFSTHRGSHKSVNKEKMNTLFIKY